MAISHVWHAEFPSGSVDAVQRAQLGVKYGQITIDIPTVPSVSRNFDSMPVHLGLAAEAYSSDYPWPVALLGLPGVRSD